MHSKSTKPPVHQHNDVATPPGLPHEADIGSGEPPPGQAETDRLIAQIPPLPEGNKKPG